MHGKASLVLTGLVCPFVQNFGHEHRFLGRKHARAESTRVPSRLRPQSRLLRGESTVEIPHLQYQRACSMQEKALIIKSCLVGPLVCFFSHERRFPVESPVFLASSTGRLGVDWHFPFTRL